MEFKNLQEKTIKTVLKKDGHITVTFADGETIVLFTANNEEIFIKTN